MNDSYKSLYAEDFTIKGADTLFRASEVKKKIFINYSPLQGVWSSYREVRFIVILNICIKNVSFIYSQRKNN